MNMAPGGLDVNIGDLMVSSPTASRTADEDESLLIREAEILGSSRISVQGLVYSSAFKGLARYRFNAKGMGCQ